MMQRIFLFAFGIVGLAFWVAAGFFYMKQKDFLATAKKTTGTVVENIPHRGKKGRIKYTPLVKFVTPNGQAFTFEGTGASRPPAFELYEKVEVYYSPQDPNQAQLGTFWQLWQQALIFGIIGTVFMAISIAAGIERYLHQKKINELLLNGQRIRASVQSVQQTPGHRKPRRPTYRIHCQWQSTFTNEIHVFKSDVLWQDPSPYLSAEIDVLIDPQNPKKYWVDVSALPGAA